MAGDSGTPIEAMSAETAGIPIIKALAAQNFPEALAPEQCALLVERAKQGELYMGAVPNM